MLTRRRFLGISLGGLTFALPGRKWWRKLRRVTAPRIVQAAVVIAPLVRGTSVGGTFPPYAEGYAA